MKKIRIRFAAVALMLLASNTVSAQVNYSQQDVDEMSYNLGFVQAEGLKEYLETEMHMDLNHLDSFVNGLLGKDNDSVVKDEDAYDMGVVVGHSMQNTMLPAINQELFDDSLANRIPLKLFMDGFIKGINASKGEFEKAQKISSEKMKFIKTEELLQIYGDNKAAGEKYLEENIHKEGVHVLPSGVQYRIIRKGSGPIPTNKDSVKVDYLGGNIEGIDIGCTYETGEPMTIKCSEAIKGFGEALTHMPVGSVWEVSIPQDQAYAEQEQDHIKPFSALIFLIELISIE